MDLKIPHPYTHTRKHTNPTTGYFWTSVLPSPALVTPPQTHTHAPYSLHPRVNIISFSDRWEGSDLVENEATNLHPYYTVIHTHLQTCITLSCTLLPRMTLNVTHFLSLHVKRDEWHRHRLLQEVTYKEGSCKVPNEEVGPPHFTP